MANIDIEIDEDNLVEKDGALYRKQEDGTLVKTGYDTLILGFKNTDLFRAQNIAKLRRDKYFNNSGIDVDSILNSFFKGAAGVMLNNLIIEEFQRLQIDMKDIVSTDKNFIRKTVITIAQ